MKCINCSGMGCPYCRGKTAEKATSELNNFVSRDPAVNKVQLHTELNAAYSTILSIAMKVDVTEGVYKRLTDTRSFLSSKIDNSDYPPC